MEAFCQTSASCVGLEVHPDGYFRGMTTARGPRPTTTVTCSRSDVGAGAGGGASGTIDTVLRSPVLLGETQVDD